MKQKTYKGDAIYNPSGKAGEYSYWACNFFVGCSNGCDYCYLLKGWGQKTYEHRYPKLAAAFKDEAHALKVFKRELLENLEQLQQAGLFFTFTSDPFLPEAIYLTTEAVDICQQNGVPVKLLTKLANAAMTGFMVQADLRGWDKSQIAIGFTLTGCDEREPGATANVRRADQMHLLHEQGYRTFASIEPILDFVKSTAMMYDVIGACDLFKIGLESGQTYGKRKLRPFVEAVIETFRELGARAYFKDGILKQAGINRDDLPADVCVNRDFNLFKSE